MRPSAEVISIKKIDGRPLRDEPAFAMWERGKRDVAIDLSSADGEMQGRALIASADVVILGLKPASNDRFELDFASLLLGTPRLVVTSLTGFGLDGPFRDVPVYDAVTQARGDV